MHLTQKTHGSFSVTVGLRASIWSPPSPPANPPTHPAFGVQNKPTLRLEMCVYLPMGGRGVWVKLVYAGTPMHTRTCTHTRTHTLTHTQTHTHRGNARDGAMAVRWTINQQLSVNHTCGLHQPTFTGPPHKCLVKYPPPHPDPGQSFRGVVAIA